MFYLNVSYYVFLMIKWFDLIKWLREDQTFELLIALIDIRKVGWLDYKSWVD